MDLAKRELPGRSLPQKTFRRETTMPRVSTDRPGIEVVQTIRRPNQDNAEELARLLGVAVDTATKAFGQIQDKHNEQDAAAALMDFNAGHKNDQRFAKSRAYRDAWQLQGAKNLGITISSEATDALQARLNDSDHPATLEDVHQVIEDVFQKHITDGDGKLLDFGTPEAKLALANTMQEVRANLIPQAMKAIKGQQDERMLGTIVSNKVYEHYRGAPIGAPVKGPAELPNDKPVVNTAPYYAPAAKVIEPFAGFTRAKPSSTMGAPREGGSKHNGEDFPIRAGTPLVSPMAGKVIASFSNERGGNQVRVQMADGAIIGMAHLSKRNVKVGDTVEAGQELGLSAATGHATGPHVHMTVEVNGKKVSPRTYFASATVPQSGPPLVTTATDPQLAAPAPKTNTALGPFDFEGAMKAVPPGIDKKTAKEYILQALVNEANDKGDVSILSGLEDSKRADGTPSLAPDEIAKVLAARQVISDRAEAQTEKDKRKLWDENHDQVLNAFLSDNPPSIGWLRNEAHRGALDPDFAFAMENHLVSQQHQDAAEARAEARMANSEANAAFDADVGGMIALRQSGDLTGASAAEDLQLYNSGQLGTGKQALSRYRQLRAAARSGEQENLRNPDVGKYAGFLKIRFGRAPTNILEKAAQGHDQINFVGMMSFFKDRIAKGESPSAAYSETILKFAPHAPDAVALRKKQIDALRAKRLGAGS